MLYISEGRYFAAVLSIGDGVLCVTHRPCLHVTLRVIV